MSKKVIYLDAGHGGFDAIRCVYTTAPDKMFSHSTGSYHDGKNFYEGVFNRAVANLVKVYAKERGIEVVLLYDEVKDTPLQARTRKANKLYDQGKDGILYSIHANACGSHTARGFEIYTSPGQTDADPIAEKIWLKVRHRIPELKLRSDTSDDDHDKEAKFWMVVKSKMPAVLLECAFFDQPQDADLLMDFEIQKKLAKIIVDTHEQFS